MMRLYLLGFAGVATTVAVSAASNNYKWLLSKTITATGQ